MGGKRISQAVIDESVDLYVNQRVEASEIAKRFGIDTGSVYRFVRRSGFDTHRPPHPRHGLTNHPLYTTWCGMKQRCNDPNHIEHERYAARGIKVCKRWSDSFVVFVEDMGPKPTPRYQLDRIDNDGNYEPDNCRWVTPSENSRNGRHNNWITFRGETKCLVEWAEEIGIGGSVLRQRIKKWGLEEALTRPKGERHAKCRKGKRRAVHKKACA